MPFAALMSEAAIAQPSWSVFTKKVRLILNLSRMPYAFCIVIPDGRRSLVITHALSEIAKFIDWSFSLVKNLDFSFSIKDAFEQPAKVLKFPSEIWRVRVLTSVDRSKSVAAPDYRVFIVISMQHRQSLLSRYRCSGILDVQFTLAYFPYQLQIATDDSLHPSPTNSSFRTDCFI